MLWDCAYQTLSKQEQCELFMDHGPLWYLYIELTSSPYRMYFCCLFGHWIGWWKWMKSGWHVFAARQLLTPTIGDLARSKSSFRQLDSSHSLLSLPSVLPGLKSLNCFDTIGQISKHTCAGSLGYNSSTWWADDAKKAHLTPSETDFSLSNTDFRAL